jgi:hypothetical protein
MQQGNIFERLSDPASYTGETAHSRLNVAALPRLPRLTRNAHETLPLTCRNLQGFMPSDSNQDPASTSLVISTFSAGMSSTCDVVSCGIRQVGFIAVQVNFRVTPTQTATLKFETLAKLCDPTSTLGMDELACLHFFFAPT